MWYSIALLFLCSLIVDNVADIPYLDNETQEFLLVAQRTKISRFNLVTKTLEELSVGRKLESVNEIEFDVKNNCLYWSELYRIIRRCYNNTKPETLISDKVYYVDGMALDWTSNTLYFVNNQRSRIESIRTDTEDKGRMRRVILRSTLLTSPGGIAVHPAAGYIFGTDWSDENSSIYRAHLDGSNFKRLIGAPQIWWPNGITIDYTAERIYWADARLKYIGSSDLNGNYFTKIISNSRFVKYPFAIVVFKNKMYWNDDNLHSVLSANKDGCGEVEILLANLPGLAALKVLGPGMQVTNSTLTNTKNSCSKGYFPCDGGHCHPLAYLCDERDDCKDGYDETNCTKDSRIYQVLEISKDQRSSNETSLLLDWWIAQPSDARLEFKPSISKVSMNDWRNETWTENSYHRFNDLQPATMYNMTVYARIVNTSRVFVPAKYFVAQTQDKVIPGRPWNVTVTLFNESHVVLSWNPPVNCNGQIVNYQISWYPPKETKLKVSGKKTSHLLEANFEPETEYSFYITAHNRAHESEKSRVVNLKFNGSSDESYQSENITAATLL